MPSGMRCNNLQIKSRDCGVIYDTPARLSHFSFGATVRRKLTAHNMVSNEKEKNRRNKQAEVNYASEDMVRDICLDF